MKVIKFHIIPALLALFIGFFLFKSAIFEPAVTSIRKHIHCCNEKKFIYNNFDTISEGINPWVSCLRDKDDIMLLGSSELTAPTPLIPYQYFNQVIHQPLTAFGHAFYQSFSMYCNLLAFKEELKDKKMCIIISPSWFETKGTNIQAFLEFVRPEMLSNIVHSDFVSENEKRVIGEYIVKNDNNFDGISLEMEYFSTLYKSYLPFQKTILDRIKGKINLYHFESVKPSSNGYKSKNIEPNWDSLANACHQNFSLQCSNSYFIKDTLLQVILDGKSLLDKRKFKPIDLVNNQEYKDFKVLIQLLKDCNAKPIFVMQGLLPTGYENLEGFNEISLNIERDLNALGFPYLNLFEPNVKEYKPGILNDFMHMGDLGWNCVNQFIYQNFYHEQDN